MSTAFSSSSGAQDGSERRLRLALTDALSGLPDGAAPDGLRDAICGYVRERRDAGDQAEAVVIAVKRIINVADLRPGRPIERRELTERVISWCIAEYYRAD
jgi:hypothetical protein